MKIFPETYTPIQHIYYCFNELRFYKDYISRYEGFIKKENVDYEKFLNNPESFFELGEKFNYQGNHSANLTTEFPNTLRRSAFISLCSYFENSLNVLCDVYADQRSLNINYQDMYGNGIERSKSYLTKIIQLDFPDTSNWYKIKKLQKIRNKIVHTYSKISNDDKLIPTINEFQYLKLYPLTSSSIIQIEELFLGSVIEIFEAFYDEISESIKKKI